MPTHRKARSVQTGRHGKARGKHGLDRASRAGARLRVLEFFKRMWTALDSPRSRGLGFLAEAECYEEIARATLDPSAYTNPLDFYLDYQAIKLASKSPHLPTGLDTRKEAEKKFIQAELACLKTNERFRAYATGDYPGPESVLNAVRRKIAHILGDAPSVQDLEPSFGPGAALGVRGETTVYHKLTATLESTHSMIPVLGPLFEGVPGWISADQAEVHMVNGSDLAFVPKDATTDRAICIEPLLNGFLQKGIGDWIRSRLRRHGIDLNDQSVNQRLATAGVSDDLCTVDFSSASDTIAYLLVWELLPPDWCELLDAARCPRFRYEGSWYSFQKFSSMGNAYTFELETLIFYAIAYASCVESGVAPATGRNLSVYGDDVIIPRAAFDLFKEVSEFCGFTLNLRKSFTEGPFRESCGCDSFAGTLVTPYRLKKGLRTTDEIFYAANLVIRIAQRISDIDSSSETAHARLLALADVHRWLVGLLPRHQLALGPADEGDGWLIAPFDRATPSQGFFGWWHRRRVTVPTKFKADGGFWPMSYALYSVMKLAPQKGAALHLSGDITPVLWSDGAAIRSRTRTRFGSTQSPDWLYPTLLAGYFWQGY